MPTTDPQTIATITQIVAVELATSPDAVDPDLDLRTVQGADSVKVLRMIARIERTYDVELDDEDVFSVTTVRQVAEVVTRTISDRAAA